MTGKFVFVLALLVAIAGIASGDGTRPTHDLIVGALVGSDYPFVGQKIEKYPHWPFTIVELQQTFYTMDERSVITLVKAIDESTDGNGAFPSLIGGGPGANNVTLFFKSQPNNGINFTVRIFSARI